MKGDDALADGVRTLLDEAARLIPARGLGVVRSDGPMHVVLTYADAFGATAFRARAADVPESVRPRRDREGLVLLAAAELAVDPAGLFETRVLHFGVPDDVRLEFEVRHIVTQPVPGLDEPALLVVAVGDSSDLTPAQLSGVGRLAQRVVDFLTRAPAPHEELELLRRLDVVDRLLPTLFQVLDVREIFDRLSAIARDVLRHDLAALGVFNENLTRVEVYVQSADAPIRARGGPLPYPPVQTRAWLYRFVDDLRTHPVERGEEGATHGGRSSIRVAIRLEDRILGALNFTSRQLKPYTATDLVIARRIADYVALALSHQRLADEARRAEALRERAANLEMLEDLLKTLSGVLDIREVFDRVSEIAQKVLPHDGMVIREMTADPARARNYALSGFGDLQLPAESPTTEPRLLTEPWDFFIVDDLSTWQGRGLSASAAAGFQSVLSLPVRFEGRLAASVNFFSRAKARFSRDDVMVARRIADHIALALSHQRLADEARRTAALRERAANLEMLEGLLTTLAGVLDVREVFDRVSEISDKVMTHDAMSISMPTEDGERLRILVATGALNHLSTPFDMHVPDRSLFERQWDSVLIADLSTNPRYAGTPSVNAGMRAMLSIPVWVEGRLGAAVNFFSRTPGHFTTDDVQVGRRIADHIALALSHQRLAEEARRNEELRARTEKSDLLDELLASVTGAGELAEVFDRVSTVTQKVLTHDALVLTALLPGGVRARVYASVSPERTSWPAVVDVPPQMIANRDWEFDLIDDLPAHPDQQNLEATTRGFRAALRVPIRLDGEYVAGVSFLSFTPSRYSTADIPVARRIADRLALSFLRERRDEASQRADAADARAAKLESRVRALTEELDARTGYRRVLGDSASWRRVLTQATQVAATDTTVLLLGESGTGKEVAARFVHRASPRREGPFIALNCAALPEQLLEAELFGYERGAFTGATQSKPGQLEQAAGGTLFLDEVGEMSPQVQAKFLRVLQEREFQRLGGTRVLRTDARIVAATNRDLQQAMSRGQFREDLFYRLNVFAIQLPPLRERKDDVLPLSDAFLTEYGRSLGRPPAGISRDARKLLLDYHWPGNVRELRNILERAAILCDGGLITAEHLALTVAPASAPAGAREALPKGVAEAASALAGPPSSPTSVSDLSAMERTLIEQALQNARFNKSKAAAALGLTRAQLYVRMKRYGLE